MNEMIQFTYNAMECPIMLDDQKNPWWIAKNVCDILGLTNITMALSRIDDDEKLTSKIFISGQRWITHEVLPAIRKTGSYAAGEPKPVKPSLKEAAVTVVDMLSKSGPISERDQERFVKALAVVQDGQRVLELDGTGGAL